MNFGFIFKQTKNEKREKFMNEYTNDGTSLEIISTQCVLFNHVYLKDMLK